MTPRKDIVIVVLATFCLAVTLFTVLPIRSSPNGYDPWIDLDDDGKIGPYDFYMFARAYGSSGDPTKNVTIAGRTNKLAYSTTTVVPNGDGGYVSPWIPVDGYSKMTVCIYYAAISDVYRLDARHSGGDYFSMDLLNDIGFHFVKTYDVPNEEIRIYLVNFDTYDRTLRLDIYLIP